MNLTQPYKILLADDNKKYLQVLKFQLYDFAQKDIEKIDEAYTGKQAVEMIKKNPYDLIFMDIDMPEMDGIDATRIIKKDFPWLRIIALSLYKNPEYINSMLMAGAEEYIFKDDLDESKIETIMKKKVLY